MKIERGNRIFFVFQISPIHVNDKSYFEQLQLSKLLVKALEENEILHYYIRPRNPEENAKIEKWWQNIGKL